MKYSATFYFNDWKHKTIKRNNKKHIFAATHKESTKQSFEWTRIVITKEHHE